MCVKVTLTKNFGIKKRYIRNDNALQIPTPELWRKKKAMTEEIVQISILHPKTFKEFYHTQGFGKVLWKAGIL